MYDFPNTPTIGQIVVVGGITRQWNGTSWSIVPSTIQGVTGARGIQGVQGNQGITGGGLFTYSTTPPSSPLVGDRWTNSNTGIEYTYVNDGNSSQWVDLGSGYVGIQGIQGTDGLYAAQGIQGIQGPQGYSQDELKLIIGGAL